MRIGKLLLTTGRKSGRAFALLLAFSIALFLGALLDSVVVSYPVAGRLYAGQTGLEDNAHLGQDGDMSNLAGSESIVLFENNFPTRLALGLDNDIYVSDAKADTVFIYDAELNLAGKLVGIPRPLGVAVAPNGNIYVGSDARDEVQIYDERGVRIQTIGSGAIRMPNDLVVDRDGWLYVADSLSNKVWIFDPNGVPAGSAGSTGDVPGQLDFPVAITIGYRTEGNVEVGELYVADQRHARIKVFDLMGKFLRAYGDRITRGMASSNWHGKFARIQSLAIDARGRLHAVDCYMNNVQILDADTGGYIDSYGQFGAAEGQLNVPLDVLIVGGKVIITNAGNKRVEVIYTVP